MPPRVCVGQIGAAHGIRGEVRLNSFTQEPLAIARYGPFASEDGACVIEIETLRQAGDKLIARLKGVSDRNAAERLRNVRLYVPRGRLPATGDEETFYHADLIGLAAVTADGATLGEVAAVHDFGAGPLIELRRPDGGPTLMLPFTKAVVPVVDLAGGRVVVEPPQEVSTDRDEA